MQTKHVYLSLFQGLRLSLGLEKPQNCKRLLALVNGDCVCVFVCNKSYLQFIQIHKTGLDNGVLVVLISCVEAKST